MQTENNSNQTVLADSAAVGSSLPLILSSHLRRQHQISAVSEHPPFQTNETRILLSKVFDGTLDARLAGAVPDVIIHSSDNIFFVVHSLKLTTASKNGFASRLPVTASRISPNNPARLSLEEPSEVLHILLLTVYAIPHEPYRPTLAVLSDAMQAMEKYGITPLTQYVSLHSPLYDAILVQAKIYPLEAYALAAANDLEDLAVECSRFTLYSTLHTMPVDLAERMGVLYMQRLFALHETREEQMKKMFMVVLTSHEEKPYCSSAQQHDAHLDFRLACGSMIWESRSECIDRDRTDCH
jgi:hypothetical protein